MAEGQKGSRIEITGRFLGFDSDKFEDKQGERREEPVMIFESDNIRYADVIRVGKDSEAEARALYGDKVGQVLSVPLQLYSGFGNVRFKSSLS